MRAVLSSAVIVFLVLFVVVGVTYASKGNIQPEFLGCVRQCIDSTCSSQPPLPLTLRFMQWDCPENCQYTCMHAVTDRAIREGTPVYQYYGKWPFYRFLGMQEPASVLFSIGNGWVHYHYLHVLRREIPNAYFLKPFMLVFSLVGINAWVWSTVFHARDLAVTEKLDYFSAGLLILYSLYYALIRIFYLRHRLVLRALSVVVLVLFLAHVGYLSLVRFDYGYNMMASVVVGSLQLLLWVVWSIAQYVRKTSRRHYAYLALVSVAGTAAAMFLELLDFPPILRILDAHSLWHLATIPLMALWYRFVLLDTRHEITSKRS